MGGTNVEQNSKMESTPLPIAIHLYGAIAEHTAQRLKTVNTKGQTLEFSATVARRWGTTGAATWHLLRE
jgi:hypothetical protein